MSYRNYLLSFIVYAITALNFGTGMLAFGFSFDAVFSLSIAVFGFGVATLIALNGK